ncbi:MAG: cobalamin-dependent protein, partial [Chitinivibrionales bacterium]|nr:cobalamin-dependent protein [Chitinivibrionales bacterium]
MRAVVAVPPIHDFYFTPHRFASLGAQIVTDILTKENFKVCLYNFPVRQSHTLPLPEQMGFLSPFIIPEEEGKCSFFTTYRHFGPIFEQCLCKIMALHPDIVFLSCFAFCYADQSLELARIIKRASPKMPVAIGGAGVSAYPGYFLKDGSIDYVFSGEAEK